ncbi:MAG: DNA-binding protein [Candidatus Aenigmatarchaeota archaeon]
MDEDELEKLREQKKQEIQGSEASQEDYEEQVENQKQQIWSQAAQYMTSEAKSRLANVKVANEELAYAVAQQVYRLGNAGQIDTVDDDRMKKILKSLQEEKENSESNIKFRR